MRWEQGPKYVCHKQVNMLCELKSVNKDVASGYVICQQLNKIYINANAKKFPLSAKTSKKEVSRVWIERGSVFLKKSANIRSNRQFSYDVCFGHVTRLSHVQG